MTKRARTQFQLITGGISFISLVLIGMWFYNGKSVEAVVICFQQVSLQVYWGLGLGVIVALLSTGLWKMDKTPGEFSLERCFVDPQTRWPVFTHVVLGIVLVVSIWFVVLLAYHEQWKLGVELVEAVITGFVAKFGLSTLKSTLEGKWQKEARQDVKQEVKEDKKIATEKEEEDALIEQARKGEGR